MTSWLRHGLLVTGGMAAALLGGWALIYLTVLGSRDVLNHPLAEVPLWPVACSSRGCVTSARWRMQQRLQTQFASATGSAAPAREQSLTTAVRQHLVRHAFVRLPVTVEDAQRYREKVLLAIDVEPVQRAVGLTFTDYDRLVLLPLLQQEAVRGERGIEDYGELFKALARERTVGILAWHYRWDAGQASVVGE